TIMTETLSLLVGMMSLREVSGSSAGTMPAAFSSGTVCSNMRPFERAILRLIFFLHTATSMCPLDSSAQLTQFFFYALVAAIQMVNAVHEGFSVCDQASQHQTR